LPDPENAVGSLSLTSEVEGTIVDFSDSGGTPRAFAVVEVVRKATVVVSTSSLTLVEMTGPDSIRPIRSESSGGKD